MSQDCSYSAQECFDVAHKYPNAWVTDLGQVSEKMLELKLKDSLKDVGEPEQNSMDTEMQGVEVDKGIEAFN